MTKIAVPVHFHVHSLDDRRLSRDEARACVDKAIRDGLVVLTDIGTPPPFVQIEKELPSGHALVNIHVSPEAEEDEDPEGIYASY